MLILGIQFKYKGFGVKMTEEEYPKMPFKIVYKINKRLDEITVGDIPPGLDPEDIAIDGGEEKIYRKQPFKITYRRTKRLEEITAEDIPPGLTPEDIVIREGEK